MVPENVHTLYFPTTKKQMKRVKKDVFKKINATVERQINKQLMKSG